MTEKKNPLTNRQGDISFVMLNEVKHLNETQFRPGVEILRYAQDDKLLLFLLPKNSQQMQEVSPNDHKDR